ncbi:unnamed protein product, partial [Porites lobata]
MTKDEYLSYVQEVKEEKEMISKGLTRVKNKYKETAQSEAETGSVDKEETPEISVNIQDDSDDGDSRSAPSVSSNTSCSESGAKSSRKRAQKSTKTFVDNK